MSSNPEIQIINITRNEKYEKYLYKCLAPMPFNRYKTRQQYLETAIPQGFRKAILVYRADVVGQIEYTPAAVSGLPISGDHVVIMNCIWVLRRAKGRHFGRVLLNQMIKSQKNAYGFSTIALENHPSGWLTRWQMEWLGFRSIDSVKIRHKVKHTEICFNVHLMWLPLREGANPSSWDVNKLLEGVTFCIAHPLYHTTSLKIKKIYEQC